MQESDFYISYHQLSEHLAISWLGPSAAEAHGMLCAMLCADESRAAESWIAELPAGTDDADHSTQACRRFLRDLAARTRAGICRPAPGLHASAARRLGALAERAVGL